MPSVTQADKRGSNCTFTRQNLFVSVEKSHLHYQIYLELWNSYIKNKERRLQGGAL